MRSLGSHEFGEPPLRDDLDGPRDLDVEDRAQGPDRGHLGRADAEGEGAEGAVARRVAVGADDDRPGTDIAVLGEDLVADAALVAPDVVELRDALLGDEFPDPLLVGRRLRALGGNPVIEDDGDPRGVPDLRLAARVLVDLLELVDDQRGVLVRHGQAHLGLDHVARPDRGLMRRPGQDLFDHRHAHIEPPVRRTAPRPPSEGGIRTPGLLSRRSSSSPCTCPRSGPWGDIRSPWPGIP